ncbi:MAG: tRNA threonylcarbamoyladenosine dehydratase [Bacteroidales bacterium]|jgi:tRNA A37 threonylcarbamoyladenosine dehydratase|nr:tRNA threonylcarbamoyladenosine dehydratase [Bacteroidales bacterium]
MQEWKERTRLLLGDERLAKLENSSVAVIGLGGVGAYAAEMLCRAGIGKLVIADNDTVSPSNKNRQLIAMDSTVGLPKSQVLASRMKDINKDLVIDILEEYLTPEKIPGMLSKYTSGKHKIDFLVDAIDTLSPKIALIKYCVENSIPHVTSMGAGAKLDATAVRIADISKSHNCPLAYILRKKLRKEGISKGFDVVFSEELPDRNAIVPVEERNKKSMTGTISYLPAVFGCACAQAAITHIIEE